MRCVSCGEEMRLLQVAEDKTKMVTGYEQHTFECSGCREVEQRLVFNTDRKGPIRRNVQIVRHAKYEGLILCSGYQVWYGRHVSQGSRAAAGDV